MLGKEGSLIGGEAPDGEGGVIIAVCANGATIDASTKLSTGAIPEAGYRGDVKRRAKAGEYRALLPECASKE
ncbi:hypothetical protein BIU96_15460 [Curtobacterium sp. MCBA15_008]|nr:hypothetical protein BIU96_15460 [Curtobacterium sp. MCBA15_008]